MFFFNWLLCNWIANDQTFICGICQFWFDRSSFTVPVYFFGFTCICNSHYMRSWIQQVRSWSRLGASGFVHGFPAGYNMCNILLQNVHFIFKLRSVCYICHMQHFQYARISVFYNFCIGSIDMARQRAMKTTRGYSNMKICIEFNEARFFHLFSIDVS